MRLSPGEAKNTYGNRQLLLLNTGTEKVLSKNGLLTTVCYKIGDAPAVYALEGSIADREPIQWLRDNLGMVEKASDIEPLAASVDDNGDCYFVPAFSGPSRPTGAGCARGHRRSHPIHQQGTSPERRWRPPPSSRGR